MHIDLHTCVLCFQQSIIPTKYGPHTRGEQHSMAKPPTGVRRNWQQCPMCIYIFLSKSICCPPKVFAWCCSLGPKSVVTVHDSWLLTCLSVNVGQRYSEACLPHHQEGQFWQSGGVLHDPLCKSSCLWKCMARRDKSR